MADITYEDIWEVLDVDLIWGTLWQGSFPPHGTILKERGFDVLVLTAADNQCADVYPGVTVICAPGDDDERKHALQRSIAGWHAAGLEVAEHVKAGRKVLVTCIAGQNRSGLVTAIALRELTGWPGKKVVSHVSQQRHLALNNRTFVDYICESYPTEKTVL